MSYSDRVRAGVALLDEKAPGWHKRIDLDRLDMGRCDRCVVGQLYGDFVDGLLDLGVINNADAIAEAAALHDKAHEVGFDTAWLETETGRAYRLLRRLWTYVIRQRQAESREIDREVREDRTRDAAGLE